MLRGKSILACTAIAFMLTACAHKTDNLNEIQQADMNDNELKEEMQSDGIVRLSKIEVYPEHLAEYLKFAVEVGEVSLRTEPGVLTMYALQDKTDSCHITILETYSSQDAYKRHIASEHFQKYKQGTLHMVKNLDLCDQTPLNPKSLISNTISENQ